MLKTENVYDKNVMKSLARGDYSAAYFFRY